MSPRKGEGWEIEWNMDDIDRHGYTKIKRYLHLENDADAVHFRLLVPDVPLKQ